MTDFKNVFFSSLEPTFLHRYHGYSMYSYQMI